MDWCMVCSMLVVLMSGAKYQQYAHLLQWCFAVQRSSCMSSRVGQLTGSSRRC
jgi:hypothetical protein